DVAGGRVVDPGVLADHVQVAEAADVEGVAGTGLEHGERHAVGSVVAEEGAFKTPQLAVHVLVEVVDVVEVVVADIDAIRGPRRPGRGQVGKPAPARMCFCETTARTPAGRTSRAIRPRRAARPRRSKFGRSGSAWVPP